MKKILAVENMRKSDAATIEGGIPGKELMRRAGEGIFKLVFDQILPREEMENDRSQKKAAGKKRADNVRADIFCGSGNNAGDGYVLALLCKENGIPCRLILSEEKFSEDGAFYFLRCKEEKIETLLFDESYYKSIEKMMLSSDTLIIFDCLLGTGFNGEARGRIRDMIEAINSVRRKEMSQDRVLVVSVDINSGLNGDSGMSKLCVKSDITVSVGDLKPGLFLNMAKDVVGRLENADIGIEPVDNPYFLFEKEDALNCLWERKNLSNKGSYGYVALVGGSKKYSGAIRLANMANAAMRSGAGVVMLAVPDSLSSLLASEVLESTLYPMSEKEGELSFSPEKIEGLCKRTKTIAFGMGIGLSEETKKILSYLLMHYEGNLIIDADGLNALAKLLDSEMKTEEIKPRSIILTPHLKEFERISKIEIKDTMSSPVESTLGLTKKLKERFYGEENKAGKLILLLKGPSTIVTDGCNTYIVDRGCPGMATAGSGDVLSGILSAIVSYNEDRLLEAVAAGAYINGLAGEIAQKEYGDISMIASDTVHAIPKAINHIRNI